MYKVKLNGEIKGLPASVEYENSDWNLFFWIIYERLIPLISDDGKAENLVLSNDKSEEKRFFCPHHNRLMFASDRTPGEYFCPYPIDKAANKYCDYTVTDPGF